MSDASAQELVPSISIEALLVKRAVIAERAATIKQSNLEIEQVYRSIFTGNDYAHPPHLMMDVRSGRQEFNEADYMKSVDASLWANLLAESGLRTFMDATTRAEWDRSIAELKVPELTRANIEATFKTLYANRSEMFEDGVIRLFRSLSWNYKTNLPHKFGKRLILVCAVTHYKRGRTTDCYGVEHAAANKLDDLIRVMSIVDGKPEPDHRSGAWHKLNAASWMRGGQRPQQQHTAELPYLSIRGFLNGNAHITFTRLDLVEHLNRIIAKHYPGALPPMKE